MTELSLDNDHIIQLLADQLSTYNEFEINNEYHLYHTNDRPLPDAEDRLSLASIRAEIIRKYPNFTEASNENKWCYIRTYLLKDAIVNIYDTCRTIDWHLLQPHPRLDYKFLLRRISWLLKNKPLVRRNISDAYGLDQAGLDELISSMEDTIITILAQ